jgi:hypothetical protein
MYLVAMAARHGRGVDKMDIGTTIKDPNIDDATVARDGRLRRSIQPSGMRGSAPDQTDVRLRSDEPKADQHQHAGQDGEQEAIGNAGRQVATD